jgi:hypothetical protein
MTTLSNATHEGPLGQFLLTEVLPFLTDHKSITDKDGVAVTLTTVEQLAKDIAKFFV